MRTDAKCLQACLKEDKEQNKITLHVLTPSHVLDQDEAAQLKTARIYDLIPRLRQGNPGLLAQTSKFDTAVPGEQALVPEWMPVLRYLV